ncbi:hypothetical protein ACFPES_02980 [Paenibacillus sp. GCM10023248]|uniref:hypothetical protein n=1 Tax=unclassified Paenibacillus TaxID=185978 RepID=UPI002379FCEE|nr:hypothetical protein [Paenibacillus sp. MAHUQ-63]MDD9265989.1 hypothetical protein [Paenibacillus sp. MAHUQ-63]
MTIKTTASIKKITSGKGVEIVLSLPSSVSLDDLNELKQRDEFHLVLGIAQMEVQDYIEPRRGLQVVTNAGVVESVKEDENQLAIDDVETEEVDDEEQSEGDVMVEDSEETDSVEEEVEHAEDDLPFTPDPDEEEDQDAPLTFLDEE